MIDIANISHRLYGILGALTLIFTCIIHRLTKNIYIAFIISSLSSLFVLIVISNINMTFDSGINLHNYLFEETDYSWKPNITHFPFIFVVKIAFVFNNIILKMIDYLFFL